MHDVKALVIAAGQMLFFCIGECIMMCGCGAVEAPTADVSQQVSG